VDEPDVKAFLWRLRVEGNGRRVARMARPSNTLVPTTPADQGVSRARRARLGAIVWIATEEQYGLAVGSLRRPRVWFGALFGAAVWGSGYVVLPAAGLYRPIWEYDRRTLADDLSAHLVYGLTTAAVFRLLSPRRGRSS
jgi:hypothetical protein